MLVGGYEGTMSDLELLVGDKSYEITVDKPRDSSIPSFGLEGAQAKDIFNSIENEVTIQMSFVLSIVGKFTVPLIAEEASVATRNFRAGTG